MKWLSIISAFIFLVSCSSNDDNRDAINETDISIVTGLNLRASEFSTPIRLGNPNVFTDSRITVYPNPSFGSINIISDEIVSDVFLIPATASKNYQDVNFRAIFNSNFYSLSSIDISADMEFLDQNSENLSLNIENLSNGHYRLVTIINSEIFWDNIYISDSDDLDELEEFWD